MLYLELEYFRENEKKEQDKHITRSDKRTLTNIDYIHHNFEVWRNIRQRSIPKLHRMLVKYYGHINIKRLDYRVASLIRLCPRYQNSKKS